MYRQQVIKRISEIEDIYAIIIGQDIVVEFYLNDVNIYYCEEYMEIVYCNGNMRVKIKYREIQGVKEGI